MTAYRTTVSLAGAAMGLLALLAVPTTVAADERGYWTTPYGEPVMKTYGECWRKQYPVDEDQTEIARECGDLSDADGDGVADVDDECPGTAEGVEVDAKGCALDDDGDGVANAEDECPGTAAGVEVDASGCALDDDGDGVANAQDECPGTRAGVEVDANGCALDSDGDGVIDADDRCPGTAAGANVNDRGCVIVETIEVDLATDGFEVDSAQLRPAMEEALREVAERLKASEGDERLTVIGHTDSTGSAEYNRDLSERRAESVADFLAEQGLDRSRMSTDGRGESEPVASNETSAGRARNRRVVIETR